MHSQGTIIHLQHMVDRACNGNTAEEKEIASILFDEVYTFVRPIYEDHEKSKNITNSIIKKYISKLNGRSVIDVRSDIHMYTASSIYVTLKKNSEESILKEGLTEYSVAKIASEDEEFSDILLSYNIVFESVKAYENAPEEFKNLPKGLIILMELYGYEECSIPHIAEMIDEDEKIVADNIGLLKSILKEMGKYDYDIEQEDIDKQETHRHIKVSGKHSKNKLSKDSLRNEHTDESYNHNDIEDDEDEVGIIDMLFPRLSQKQRTLIDIVMACVIFIVGMIILRF